MRHAAHVACTLATRSAAPVTARPTVDRPRGHACPYELDTGLLNSEAAESRTVYQNLVQVGGARWLRMPFAEADLAPGSFVFSPLPDGLGEVPDERDSGGHGPVGVNPTAMSAALSSHTGSGQSFRFQTSC